jgi:hypothetical protein
MVDASILNLMPKGSWVINAARGGIVVEADLCQALDNGHIRGAGIDTWDHEPNLGPLARHPLVVASPHIGASTEQAQKAIGLSVAEQVLKFLNNQVNDYPVNLPNFGEVGSEVKPYLLLMEKLGSLIAQILDFHPHSWCISYDNSRLDHPLLRRALAKGYLSMVCEGQITYVNALAKFEGRGMSWREQGLSWPENSASSPSSKVVVELRSNRAETLRVGGLVFDDTNLRITEIHGFRFEALPQGRFLLVRNQDVPGVIGRLGTLLATFNVNISAFNLSRLEAGGSAMAFIQIDSEPSKALVTALKAIDGIHAVQSIVL